MGNVENFKALTEQITRELKGRREKLEKDAYEASRRLFVKAQAIVERCQRGNLSKPDEDLIALANDVQLKLIRIGGATEDAKRAKDLIGKFGDVALSVRPPVVEDQGEEIGALKVEIVDLKADEKAATKSSIKRMESYESEISALKAELTSFVTAPEVEEPLVPDDQDTDGLGEGSDDDAPEETEQSPEDEAEAQAGDVSPMTPEEKQARGIPADGSPPEGGAVPSPKPAKDKGDNPTSGTFAYSEGGAGKARNASGMVKPKLVTRKKASKKVAKKK